MGPDLPSGGVVVAGRSPGGDGLGALRRPARSPITERIAILVMPALISIVSRAIIRIRIGGACKSQRCERCGSESDLAHFVFSLGVRAKTCKRSSCF